MKKILAICGSTRHKSVNKDLLTILQEKAKGRLDIVIFQGLDQLPHFNQDIGDDLLSDAVRDFRAEVEQADGLIFSTPEYVFSVPGVVKNAIEWLVSTTLLSEKPVAIITASTAGEHAHESLQLILKTLYMEVSPETSLLISGVKSKINVSREITDPATEQALDDLLTALVNKIQ